MTGRCAARAVADAGLPRRRPRSEYEKVADKISQSDREREMRKAWNAAKTTEQDAAIASALTGLGLSADEIKSETATAKKDLAAGASSKVMTTGA